MFNVKEIFINNDSTFYDFNSQKRVSQWRRWALTFLVAAVAAIFCPNVSDDLLAGFLAVQSILLGFTFNVMFFLLGNREKEEPKETLKVGAKAQSLETKLRTKRVRKLYVELFYNVSYFNLIAVTSIIVAAALLLPTPEVPGFLRAYEPVETYVQWLHISTIPTVVRAASRGMAMFVFYAIAIEVFFTIARVIGRTSFYFERKLDEVRPKNSDE